MIPITIVVLVLIAGTLSVLNIAPRLGKKPSGVWLEKIEKSKNFRGGTFVNPEKTDMDRPPYEAMKEVMKKDATRNPASAIVTHAVEIERYNQAPTSELLITWLGHSSFLIKMKGKTILIDPVFSKRASMFRNIGPKKFPYTHEHTVDELPPIDMIMLTHDHYDHLDDEVIKSLKDRVELFYVPLGVGAHLDHWGVDPLKIIEFDWWDEQVFGGITFTATPGRHFTGRQLTDRFKTLWCGWAMNDGKHNIFLSGDTGYYNGFKTIGEKLGPFDFAMVECGQYSRYWPLIHLMPEESVQVALDVQSKMAMPIHWGKFKLSIHPWNEPPIRFSAKAKEEGLPVVIPVIGQAFSLDDAPLSDWWQD
jgi:L-ascorbate metabolism protein UlaG (beta-lactamase superfamily)